MTENIGNVYPATIPSITDDADIQTAFRLFHYGSDTSTPSSIPANSLAGHLTNLENTKVDTVPTILTSTSNPDNLVTTGFYVQPGTPTSGNYPALLAGMLIVVNNGTTVFQQYQVIGAAESGVTINSANRIYWRHKAGTSWRPWRTYIDEADFATLGDAIYSRTEDIENTYATQTYVNALASTLPSTYLTITEANTRALIQENIQTGNYTLQLSDANKVVAVNNSAEATVTVPSNSSVAFPIGSIVNVYAMSNQTLNVAGAAGVAVRNAGRLFERYVEVSLRKRATDEWVASGNIIPS